MIKLYQFPFSHFCEKARWALEYKRLAYRPVNLLPGLHLKPVRKLALKSCVPVLVDGATVVQESSAIITYLDTKFPTPALTPRESQAARAALDWESYLDEHIGVNLRLWFYHHALPDRDLALRFLLQGAPWSRSALFKLIYPKVRKAMVQFMNINATYRQTGRRAVARGAREVGRGAERPPLSCRGSFFQSGLNRLRTSIALVPSARRPCNAPATARDS
jgi:glutathione S-transferase